MKKFFTLIATVFTAMSMNAQSVESYKSIIVNDDKITLAPEFAAVVDANNVATNVDENGTSVVNIATENMDLQAVGGATPKSWDDGGWDENGNVIAWNDIKWENKNNKLDINDAEGTKLYFLAGTGNPYVVFDKEKIVRESTGEEIWREKTISYLPGMETMPVTGLYYKFTPKANGTLKVQIWANKGSRHTYVIDDATKAMVPYQAEGYVNGQRANYDTPAIDPETGEPKLDNQGNPVYEQYQIFFTAEELKARHDAAMADKIAAINDNPDFTDADKEREIAILESIIDAGNQAFWGWITFDVSAGNSYWLFQDTSQVGFGGYDFTYTTAAIHELQNTADNENAPFYNLAGQRVMKGTKGIVIQNGKKMVNK